MVNKASKTIYSQQALLKAHTFLLFVLPSGSSCNYIYDSKAFIFSLVNKPGWAPVKLSLPGVEGSFSYSEAIYGCSTLGPTFGSGNDICIYNNASSGTTSFTDLGWSYAAPSGYSFGSTLARTFLAGTFKFQPDEVETFYEAI